MTTAEFDKKYPEHAKLDKVKEKTEFLGEFMEWAGSQGMQFHKYIDTEERNRPILAPVNESISKLLADFTGVNLVKLEEEKQRMLKAFQTV